MTVEFADWVAARTPALMRTAFLLTGDWQRAEDLLQTALMKCYGRWDRLYEPDAHVRKALMSTYAGWRRRRWTGEHPGALPDRPDPRDAMSDATDRTDLLRMLAALPARQRAIVVLRYYEDLSENAVAELLGISVGHREEPGQPRADPDAYVVAARGGAGGTDMSQPHDAARCAHATAGTPA